MWLICSVYVLVVKSPLIDESNLLSGRSPLMDESNHNRFIVKSVTFDVLRIVFWFKYVNEFG